LEEGEHLRSPLHRFLNGRPVAAIVKEDEAGKIEQWRQPRRVERTAEIVDVKRAAGPGETDLAARQRPQPVALHRQGRLGEAERAYRAILKLNPDLSAHCIILV